MFAIANIHIWMGNSFGFRNQWKMCMQDGNRIGIQWDFVWYWRAGMLLQLWYMKNDTQTDRHQTELAFDVNTLCLFVLLRVFACLCLHWIRTIRHFRQLIGRIFTHKSHSSYLAFHSLESPNWIVFYCSILNFKIFTWKKVLLFFVTLSEWMVDSNLKRRLNEPDALKLSHFEIDWNSTNDEEQVIHDNWRSRVLAVTKKVQAQGKFYKKEKIVYYFFGSNGLVIKHVRHWYFPSRHSNLIDVEN